MTLPFLAQRNLRPELMDQSAMSQIEHVRALRGLRRLNIASCVSRQLWQQMRVHRRAIGSDRLRILDVACGGGDIAYGIWRRARRRGVEVEIVGLDRSPTACEQASRRCRAAGTSMTFHCTNVVGSPLPRGFDVVMSSLFLHHLSRPDAVLLLSNMGGAGRLLVVSDLRRSVAGYLAAHAACRLVTRSPIVRYDGPQSVANAFSVSEARGLCAEAGLSDAAVGRAWPWRLMITRYKSEHRSCA